jgi:hypothetical protein
VWWRYKEIASGKEDQFFLQSHFSQSLQQEAKVENSGRRRRRRRIGGGGGRREFFFNESFFGCEGAVAVVFFCWRWHERSCVPRCGRMLAGIESKSGKGR